MPTTIGSLRRLILTPSLADVSFAGRGFPAPPGRPPNDWKPFRRLWCADSNGASIHGASGSSNAG